MNERYLKESLQKQLKMCDTGMTHDLAWLLYRPCMASATATRSCSSVHGRASHLLLLALSRLRLTSILPSIPPKSYLSHQNEKVLPGSTDEPQYKHN